MPSLSDDVRTLPGCGPGPGGPEACLEPDAGSAIQPEAGRAIQPDAGVAIQPEAGSAIIEFIFLAVLLMIPVAYLILTVGQIQGGAYAAVGAADQAAKVFVLHKELPAAHEAAEQAVRLAVQDMGFDPDSATLDLSCDPDCTTAGAKVRAHVQLKVELPVVGSLPGVNATAATVESTAMQKVGRFK